jgi:hypothetical protein
MVTSLMIFDVESFKFVLFVMNPKLRGIFSKEVVVTIVVM